MSVGDEETREDDARVKTMLGHAKASGLRRPGIESRRATCSVAHANADKHWLMQTFIHDQNIRHFRELLGAPLDMPTRKTIMHLLEQETAKHECARKMIGTVATVHELDDRKEGSKTAFGADQVAAMNSSHCRKVPSEVGSRLLAAKPPPLECFQDELKALAYLQEVLWPNGPVCPRCGTHGRVGRLDGTSTRLGTFKCYACRRNFSITRGTLFGSSHVPLHKWLQTIYLTASGTAPMRPTHLARIINVSFKTADGMMKRLRIESAPS